MIFFNVMFSEYAFYEVSRYGLKTIEHVHLQAGLPFDKTIIADNVAPVNINIGRQK